MRSTFLEALEEIASGDENFMLLAGDLGFGVFEEFAERHPNKYLNCGILEQSIIGIASGLAISGKNVFIYSISNFITLRCLEQIRNDACYHELNITIIGSGGGFTYGALGMSHHATEEIGILRTLPNMDIVAPCDREEVYGATIALSRRQQPGYLRLEKSLVASGCDEPFILGEPRLLHKNAEGLDPDVMILAMGGVVEEALQAAQMLEDQAIGVTVCSVPTIKPVSAKLPELLRRCPIVLSVEEHNVINGLGSLLAELFMEHAIYPTRFVKLGLNDVYSSIVGDQKYLRKHYGMDAGTIFKTAIDTLKAHKAR